MVLTIKPRDSSLPTVSVDVHLVLYLNQMVMSKKEKNYPIPTSAPFLKLELPKVNQ